MNDQRRFDVKNRQKRNIQNGNARKGVPSNSTKSEHPNNARIHSPQGIGNKRQGRPVTPPDKKSNLKGFFTPKMTLYFSLGAIALLLGICMMISITIGVRSIEVKGCDMVSPDEIISACGITEGSGYFSYNTGKAENKILDSIPCITEADIDRSIFGRVVITVSEKKAYWYTEVYGEYYALSESLEVIRRTDRKKEFIDRGLVRLDFPEVKSAILGRVIEFTDGDRDCSFVSEFLSDIRDTELYKRGRMDQICIETKFEIFVVCDLKYKINLGKYSSVGVKLDMVSKALTDEQFEGDTIWEIDVSAVSRIVTRENHELDFSYLKA